MSIYNTNWRSDSGEFPDCHIDLTQSNYNPAQSCNVLNGIYAANRNGLDDVFNNKTPGTSKMPALIITEDKRVAQNSQRFRHYTDNESVVINNKPACNEPFNVRNLNDSGILQSGYARNIDLDSELKRINYIHDKCYYDSYKLHPNDADAPNGLYCNREALVKDYHIMGKPICAKDNSPQSVITPPQKQPKMPITHGWSTDRVAFGKIADHPSESASDYTPCQSILRKPESGKCTPKLNSTFVPCQPNVANDQTAQMLLQYTTTENRGNARKYYLFNGNIENNTQKFTNDYPCQRAFNNNTKRRSLPNMFNTFDLNPKIL